MAVPDDEERPERISPADLVDGATTAYDAAEITTEAASGCGGCGGCNGCDGIGGCNLLRVSSLLFLAAFLLPATASPRPVVVLLRAYQRWLTRFTPRCPSTPSCSAYAIVAVGARGPRRGLAAAARRVRECGAAVPGVGPTSVETVLRREPPGSRAGGAGPAEDVRCRGLGEARVGEPQPS